MSKITAIRDLDEDTFRKFRAMAIEENVRLGDAVNMAMKRWLAEKESRKEIPDPKFLLEICGIIKTKTKVRWSEEVDEILYG